MTSVTEHNKPSPGYTWARHGHYLDSPTLLKRVPFSRSTLDRLLGLDQFPRPARVGGKLWWAETVVEDYMRGGLKPAPPVVDDDNDTGLDDLPVPAKRPRGRPPGSKTKTRTAPEVPQRRNAIPSTLPAHLGGPTILETMRGAR